MKIEKGFEFSLVETDLRFPNEMTVNSHSAYGKETDVVTTETSRYVGVEKGKLTFDGVIYWTIRAIDDKGQILLTKGRDKNYEELRITF